MPVTGKNGGLAERLLLTALLDLGAADRAQVSQRTGLSVSAVSATARDLITRGVISEEVPAAGAERGRGRPATVLRVAPADGAILGIDLGNTHLRVAVARADGDVVVEQATRLELAADPHQAVECVETEVREVLARAELEVDDVRLAVLGLPVPLDGGLVAGNNVRPDWLGHRPGDVLAARLGIDVVVENDANLGALAEQQADADAGGSLIYVKAGTGIGAGLVLDGRLHRGDGGTAGEIGHVQVDPAGVLCRCGARGCLETVVSLPRLLETLEFVTGEALEGDDLGRLVAESHPAALRVVADAGRTVGQALASLITVLNPAEVVIGGSLPSVNVVLAQHVRTALDQWGQPAAAQRVSVRAAALGDRAELVGALALARTVLAATERSTLLGSQA